MLETLKTFLSHPVVPPIATLLIGMLLSPIVYRWYRKLGGIKCIADELKVKNSNRSEATYSVRHVRYIAEMKLWNSSDTSRSFDRMRMVFADSRGREIGSMGLMHASISRDFVDEIDLPPKETVSCAFEADNGLLARTGEPAGIDDETLLRILDEATHVYFVARIIPSGRKFKKLIDDNLQPFLQQHKPKT